MKLTRQQQELVKAAVDARQSAYAPYSRFKVGAALRLKNGKIVTGVNVENVSYGLTICAERNAVATAVQAGAKPGDIVEIAVVAEVPTTIPPCGACRQVLAEFAVAKAPVLMHRVQDGHTELSTLGELLPLSFDAQSLPQSP